MSALLLKLRAPLAVCAAASSAATVMAFSRYYAVFPIRRPPSWEDVPVLAAVIAFAGCSAVAILTQAWQSVRGRPPLISSLAATSPPPFRHATVAAACLLAVMVLAEGSLHLGPQAGYLATGRPRFEADLISADGYVVWLDGQPLASDSSAFIKDYRLLSGHERQGQPHLSIPGRVVYPYLVSLVASFVAPLGGTYAAFAVTNMLCWWLGALATQDLARRATSSWWGGLIAGTLVAAGLGFTFMAGGATSHAAAYGLVPIVLWLAERLDAFDSRAPWRILVIHAIITAAAGLTYSLLPFYLGSVVLYHAGRAPLSRLCVWSAITLLVSQSAAGALFQLTGGAATTLYAGGMRTFAAVGVVLVVLSLIIAAPQRAAERAVSAAALAAASLIALIAALARSSALVTPQAALAALQVPAYYVPQILGVGETLGAATQDLDSFLSTLQRGFVAAHFPTAFPPVLWPFAALGLAVLTPRWRDWAIAQLVCITLFAGAAILADVGGRPRLAYVAFPAVYMLAARGVLQVSSLAHTLAANSLRPTLGRTIAPRLLSAVVCVACLLVLVYPANASLLGDWQYDYRFHGIQP